MKGRLIHKRPWHPRGYGFPLTLKVGLGILALVFVLVGLSGQSARAERTAVAPISVISIGRQRLSPFRQPIGMSTIASKCTVRSMTSGRMCAGHVRMLT